MIMEWLRKKTIHKIWRKNGAEKRQVGEQKDEIRLLNHVVLQNDSIIQPDEGGKEKERSVRRNSSRAND